MKKEFKEVYEVDWKKFNAQRIEIFIFKLIGLLLNLMVIAGLFYLLFKIEGRALIDGLEIGIFFVFFIYIIQYYLVLSFIETEEFCEVKDIKALNAIENACTLAVIPRFLRPKFVKIKDKSLNACTWGPNIPFLTALPFFGSVVGINEGLIQYMEQTEIEAVLLHELGHINAYDSVFKNLSTLISLLKEYKLDNFWKGLTLEKLFFGLAWSIIIFLLPVVVAVYSQEAEKGADLYTVRSMRSPTPLYNALNKMKIYYGIGDETEDIYKSIISTHPVLNTRLNYLLELSQ